MFLHGDSVTSSFKIRFLKLKRYRHPFEKNLIDYGLFSLILQPLKKFEVTRVINDTVTFYYVNGSMRQKVSIKEPQFNRKGTRFGYPWLFWETVKRPVSKERFLGFPTRFASEGGRFRSPLREIGKIKKTNMFFHCNHL